MILRKQKKSNMSTDTLEVVPITFTTIGEEGPRERGGGVEDKVTKPKRKYTRRKKEDNNDLD